MKFQWKNKLNPQFQGRSLRKNSRQVKRKSKCQRRHFFCLWRTTEHKKKHQVKRSISRRLLRTVELFGKRFLRSRRNLTRRDMKYLGRNTKKRGKRTKISIKRLESLWRTRTCCFTARSTKLCLKRCLVLREQNKSETRGISWVMRKRRSTARINR